MKDVNWTHKDLDDLLDFLHRTFTTSSSFLHILLVQ